MTGADVAFVGVDDGVVTVVVVVAPAAAGVADDAVRVAEVAADAGVGSDVATADPPPGTGHAGADVKGRSILRLASPCLPHEKWNK